MPAAIPQETQQKILLLRQQGYTGAQIAQAVGCSTATACRVLRGHRPGPQRSSWEALSLEQQKLILEQYQKGYSARYLSQVHKVPMKRLAQELPGTPFARQTGLTKLLAIEEHVIKEYQETNVGARDIARRYGVHERTVQSFLQMRGLLKAKGAQSGEHNPQSRGEAKDNDRYWAKQVVEAALGQKLPRGCVIHHMNEVPADQVLSNLWLFERNVYHLRYHQRQLANLQQGGLLPPSRLAKDNGGLWLPEILFRLEAEPDTTVQILFDRQPKPRLVQQESEPEMVGSKGQ